MTFQTRSPKNSRWTGREGIDIVLAFSGLVVGVGYSVLLYWTSAFSMAAGDGSYLPWLIFVTDRLSGLLTWPIVGALVALRHRRWAVLGLAAVLMVSLVGVALEYSAVADRLSRDGDLEETNFMTCAAIALYGLGQAAGWLVVLRRLMGP